MRAMGIDVSVARDLDVIVLNEQREIIGQYSRVKLADLIQTIQASKPDIVAIDSPANFPINGRRATEAFVSSLGMSLYTTPWKPENQGKPFYEWMKIGFEVFKVSKEAGFPLFSGAAFHGSAIEVFPEASAVVLARRLRPRETKKHDWRRNILAKCGVSVSTLRTNDSVDAALAATTGLLALQGHACWKGNSQESVIVLPCLEAELPHSFRDPQPQQSQ
jgi:predicted nuclease with RNAse H fold